MTRHAIIKTHPAKYLLLVGLMLCVPFIIQAKEPTKKKGNGNEAAYNLNTEPDALPDKPAPARHVRPHPIHQLTGRTLGAGHINTKYAEGIDVSHYQGNINWDLLVRNAKISYVYIKATEGAEIKDEFYAQNVAGARRAGLSVGSYHFYRPQVPAQQQLQNMVSVVKASEQDLVPIIDIEHAGRNEARFIADLKAFIELVTQHYGKKPMLYTYQNFYNKHFVGLFPDYPWMIACYGGQPAVLNDGHNYLIWQYSSSSQMQGIPARVDRSRLMFNQSLERIRY
ncbi:MAG: glycosyl hydrolase family 25 [Alloprevotella sp.]|nr:glycosyl hydrolase family 25 [Alloprevotella sp.]